MPWRRDRSLVKYAFSGTSRDLCVKNSEHSKDSLLLAHQMFIQSRAEGA